MQHFGHLIKHDFSSLSVLKHSSGYLEHSWTVCKLAVFRREIRHYTQSVDNCGIQTHANRDTVTVPRPARLVPAETPQEEEMIFSRKGAEASVAA